MLQTITNTEQNKYSRYYTIITAALAVASTIFFISSYFYSLYYCCPSSTPALATIPRSYTAITPTTNITLFVTQQQNYTLTTTIAKFITATCKRNILAKTMSMATLTSLTILLILSGICIYVSKKMLRNKQLSIVMIIFLFWMIMTVINAVLFFSIVKCCGNYLMYALAQIVLSIICAALSIIIQIGSQKYILATNRDIYTLPSSINKATCRALITTVTIVALIILSATLNGMCVASCSPACWITINALVILLSICYLWSRLVSLIKHHRRDYTRRFNTWLSNRQTANYWFKCSKKIAAFLGGFSSIAISVAAAVCTTNISVSNCVLIATCLLTINLQFLFIMYKHFAQYRPTTQDMPAIELQELGPQVSI